MSIYQIANNIQKIESLKMQNIVFVKNGIPLSTLL